MAFIPVPGVAQFALRYTLFGQQVQNTLYFAGLGPETPGELALAAEQLRSSWATRIMPNLHNALTFNSVYVLPLWAEDAPTFETPVTPVSGSVGDTALPGNATWVVKFLTEGRGRTSRGRIFLPGLSSLHVGNNVVNNVWAGVVAASVGNACGDVEAAHPGVVHVVVSRYLNNVPRAQGVYRTVTRYTYSDLNVDSQRRRLNGRGA